MKDETDAVFLRFIAEGIVFFGTAWVVQAMLWPQLMVPVFHLPAITYWQACLLKATVVLLSGTQSPK